MRSTPLAVYLSLCDDDKQLAAGVKADVQFTHCNPIVYEAVYLYCKAIGIIVRERTTKGSTRIIFKKVKEAAEQKDFFGRDTVGHNGETPLKWLRLAKEMADNFRNF